MRGGAGLGSARLPRALRAARGARHSRRAAPAHLPAALLPPGPRRGGRPRAGPGRAGAGQRRRRDNKVSLAGSGGAAGAGSGAGPGGGRAAVTQAFARSGPAPPPRLGTPARRRCSSARQSPGSFVFPCPRRRRRGGGDGGGNEDVRRCGRLAAAPLLSDSASRASPSSGSARCRSPVSVPTPPAPLPPASAAVQGRAARAASVNPPFCFVCTFPLFNCGASSRGGC